MIFVLKGEEVKLISKLQRRIDAVNKQFDLEVFISTSAHIAVQYVQWLYCTIQYITYLHTVQYIDYTHTFQDRTYRLYIM